MSLRNQVMMPSHASAVGNVCGAAGVGSLPTRPQHVLGNAYAPRRLVFATRYAYALAQQLVTTAAG